MAKWVKLQHGACIPSESWSSGCSTSDSGFLLMCLEKTQNKSQILGSLPRVADLREALDFWVQIGPALAVMSTCSESVGEITSLVSHFLWNSAFQINGNDRDHVQLTYWRGVMTETLPAHTPAVRSVMCDDVAFVFMQGFVFA